MYFTLIVPVLPETYISESELRKSEKEMLDLLNIERKKKGIHKLEFNSDLYRIAMEHNQKMASEDQLAHNFAEYKKLDQRLIDMNLYFVAAGENIAFSNVYPSDYIHDGFVKSAPHFENIIDKKFRHCGIAILETDKGFYITQEFGDIMNLISTGDAKREIEDFINKNLIFSNKIISKKLDMNFRKKLADISVTLLKKGSIEAAPGDFEGYDLLTIQASRIGEIKKFVVLANILKKYDSFALGVTAGRSEKYPGGVFSIALLMKKGLKNNGRALEEIESEILENLNIKIREIRGQVFRYDKKLSQTAAKTVKDYYSGDNSLIRNRSYNILAYQVSDPLVIPDKHIGFFFANIKKSSIGIKILRPEQKGIPADYYLIAFVFRN